MMDILRADRRPAEGDDLIEHRFGIAQGSISPARDGVGGSWIEGDLLALRDE